VEEPHMEKTYAIAGNIAVTIGVVGLSAMTFQYSETWSLLIIPCILWIILFPYWRIAIIVGVFLSFVKYATEWIYYGGTIPPQVLSHMLIDSLVNWSIFLLVAHMRMKYGLALRQFKESEERYRNLVRYAPEAIVIHAKGMIRYVNEAGVVLMGAKTYEELVGKSVMGFVHPECLEIMIQRMAEIQQKGAAAPIEYKVVRLDGNVMDLEVRSAVIQYKGEQAFQSIALDVTARKRLEQALAEQTELYRLITEHSYDLIKVVDAQGVIQFASPSHQLVLGSKPDELIGSSFLERAHPDDVPKLQEDLEKSIVRHEVSVAQYRRKHKNGTWVWLEGVVAPMEDRSGHVRQWVITARDITERKQYEARLAHFAYHDPLTQLPNRRHFQDYVENTLRTAKQEDRQLAVMYLDLDGFKVVNDTYGHDTGDQLLLAFTKRLASCVRNGDVVARLGGDEFMVCLPNITDPKEVEQVAHRIITTLQEPFHIEGCTIPATSSIGIALFPTDGKDADTLIKQADIALYAAKRQGKNTFAKAAAGGALPDYTKSSRGR
jgi:diguanylate cyclase (GGDEF)-like protein/PAS domain S-box-containing protein